MRERPDSEGLTNYYDHGFARRLIRFSRRSSVGTLIEDGLTAGGGILDDPFTLGAGVALIKRGAVT